MVNAIYFYRVAHWFYKYNVPLLPKILKAIIFLLYNCVLCYETKIGKGTYLSYGGIGVIIHKRAFIGENVIIGSNVTIGGRSGIQVLPSIGNNVYISTGAKILGNVTIGDYAVIGANAVVIKDVPPNAVVGGVPAKILSYKGGPDYYDIL